MVLWAGIQLTTWGRRAWQHYRLSQQQGRLSRAHAATMQQSAARYSKYQRDSAARARARRQLEAQAQAERQRDAALEASRPARLYLPETPPKEQ